MCNCDVERITRTKYFSNERANLNQIVLQAHVSQAYDQTVLHANIERIVRELVAFDHLMEHQLTMPVDALLGLLSIWVDWYMSVKPQLCKYIHGA